MRQTLRTVTTAAWWSIVLFSSGGSAGGDWTRRILQDLFGFTGQALDTANFLTRKGGHFLYYAILTGLLAWTLRGFGARQWLGLAALLAITTGACDEYRQSLFGNRSGTAWDLLYDGVGVGLAVLLLCRAAKA